jgi:hypothetical protein
MNTYMVTIREPKKQIGRYTTTRGVIVAEDDVKALETVKGHYGTARGWHPEATFDIIQLAPGFFPM